jgi:ketosteroid isomerase-like protein
MKSEFVMATQADDEAEVLHLDNAWNEAYLKQERGRLADILADDFTGLMPSGEPITKASLVVQNPPVEIKSIKFSEQYVQVFGNAGISRGRLTLEFDDRRIDQRFLRVFAKRDGRWRAVAVSVLPVLK